MCCSAAGTGEEQASHRRSPARLGQHRLVRATGRLLPSTAKSRGSLHAAASQEQGPQLSTHTHQCATSSLCCHGTSLGVMEWAARALVPWQVPRGNDAVLGMWGHWGMLVCLYFEQTPLCVMSYCSVPEWWLTHQGPLFGDICVQAPYCTQSSTSCPHGLFAKPCSWFCSWFGLVSRSQVGLPSWLCWSCEG